jgi:hypothetical protein
MPGITIDESRAGHIFREARGHFAEDNDVNRQLLIHVVSRRRNFLRTDRAGNAWYAENLVDGTQIWVPCAVAGLSMAGSIRDRVTS